MFKAIRNLFVKKTQPNKLLNDRLWIEREHLNQWQKTEVVVNIINCPFMTLTESKVPNVWYHESDSIDKLFSLEARGFHVLPKGSKSAMARKGLLR